MAGLIAGIALAATAGFGGWEWAVLCSIVVLTLWLTGFGAISVVASLGLSLCWLALYVGTGDRRLFFPYAMQLAVQMGCLLRGRVNHPSMVGGGGILALFLAIRVAQSATAGVLFVEFLVASVSLAIALGLYAPASRTATAQTRITAGAIGSLLAFAGLAL